MKYRLIFFLVMEICLIKIPAFSQIDNQAVADTALLGLPGDNLDLYAVLNVFQQSKTIEDFEKTLNLKETGINNLDLDLNDTVDFIKVVTKQDGTNFTFILQVDVSKNEVQDVAVILVSKDADGKVSMQIVGDKDLYGNNYVIEPQPATPAATPNPAYTGTDPVTTATPASSTVVVVESAPIVQYVYSPVYVPYYPPYYYGYYPPYHAAFTVMAVSVYHHNNYYHHSGYHGGYGNTVIIHNENNYNNYNNSRNSSATVKNNNNSGNYNKNNSRNNTSTRPSTTQSKGSSSSSRTSSNKSNVSSSSRSNSMGSTSSRSTSKGSTSSRSTSRGSYRPSGGGRRR